MVETLKAAMSARKIGISIHFHATMFITLEEMWSCWLCDANGRSKMALNQVSGVQ
jgi:hypothetical protein